MKTRRIVMWATMIMLVVLVSGTAFCSTSSGNTGSDFDWGYEFPEDPETEAPTEPNTEAPTEPETEAPTEPETEAPTEPETEAPTEPETEAPTEPETEAPTVPEPETPTEPETEAPTRTPSGGGDGGSYVTDLHAYKFPEPKPVIVADKPVMEDTEPETTVSVPAPKPAVKKVIAKKEVPVKRELPKTADTRNWPASIAMIVAIVSLTGYALNRANRR